MAAQIVVLDETLADEVNRMVLQNKMCQKVADSYLFAPDVRGFGKLAGRCGECVPCFTLQQEEWLRAAKLAQYHMIGVLEGPQTYQFPSKDVGEAKLRPVPVEAED